MRLLLFAWTALALFVLTACGGGGGTPLVKPSVTVDWPQRSKDVTGPSSALSVTFLLHDPSGKQADVSFSGNRDSNLAPHTETFTAGTGTQRGQFVLTGNFFASANQTGAGVGTFTINVAVQSTGAMTNADGTPLGPIQTTGQVRSVVVAGASKVNLGSSIQLSATALDGSGNPLAITPGSFVFQVATGASNLSVTPDGVATGNARGSATVTASTDSIASAGFTVDVISPANASVAVDWPLRTRNAAGPSSALSVTFTLHDPTSQQSDVTFSADRSSNLAAHTESYTAPSTVLPGAFTLSGTFYSAASEAGIAVATFAASVAVQQDGSLTNPDGTPLGTIQFVGVVNSVSVSASQVVRVGGTQQLAVTALDKSSSILALSPGSFNWSVAAGGAYIAVTPDGIARGLAPGTAMVSATVDGVASPTASVICTSSWWKFRANIQNTSMLGGSGADGTVLWATPNGGDTWSSPAIGPDGTIYVGGGDNGLHAYAPGGTQKWSFATGNIIMSSPAVGTDGTIYFGSEDGTFYALNPDGSPKWTFQTGAGIQSSPTIGSDGTIYIGSYDGNFYALNPNGSRKWAFPTAGQIFPSPAIGSDGTLYLGSAGMYAINPDGSQKWFFSGDRSYFQTPTVGPDGTIYVAASSGTLYAVNPDGSQKWASGGLSGDYGLVCSSPALGADGTLYLGTNGGSVYAINSDGSQKWSYSIGGFVQSDPSIGSDGTIYINSDNGTFFAFNPDGSVKWSSVHGGSPSCPAIGGDGTIYATSSDGNLYAYGNVGARRRSRGLKLPTQPTPYHGPQPVSRALRP